MLLQNLIRNIFQYEKVIPTSFSLLRECLLATSFEKKTPKRLLNHVLNHFKSTRALRIPQLNTVIFSDSYLGTHTIVTTKLGSLRYFSSKTLLSSMELATNGNRFITMLMRGGPYEKIATVSKTETFEVIKRITSTTGFATEKISLLLFHETHEMREYLGEFSLPHEETLLMYLKEGGE